MMTFKFLTYGVTGPFLRGGTDCIKVGNAHLQSFQQYFSIPMQRKYYIFCSIESFRDAHKCQNLDTNHRIIFACLSLALALALPALQMGVPVNRYVGEPTKSNPLSGMLAWYAGQLC